MFRSKGFVVSALAAAVFAGAGVAVTTAVGSPVSGDETLAGKTIVQWHKQAVKMRVQRDQARSHAGVQIRALRNQVRHARFAVVHKPDSIEAIRIASIAYGQSYGDMPRVASCETGGNFSPYSKNSSSDASGLFQFMPSTFRSTPYGASESIWSPYASAMAAGWMWTHGRRNEWVCQ